LAFHLKIKTRKEPDQAVNEKVNMTSDRAMDLSIEQEDLMGFEIDIFETSDDDGEVRINIQAETYFNLGKEKPVII
jgi:hypothetical protein